VQVVGISFLFYMFLNLYFIIAYALVFLIRPWLNYVIC